MNHQTPAPAMSQRIFKLGLPIETISVYLLCCGLQDTGAPLSFARLLPIWNSTPEALQDGLRLLCEKGVLAVHSQAGEVAAYRIADESQWS
jgi:hypothetical protein